MAEQLITTEVPENFIEPDGTRPGKLIVKAGEISIWRNQFGKSGIPTIEELQWFVLEGKALDIQAEFDKVYSGKEQYNVKKIKLASGEKAEKAVVEKKEQSSDPYRYTDEEARQISIMQQTAFKGAIDLLCAPHLKDVFSVDSQEELEYQLGSLTEKSMEIIYSPYKIHRSNRNNPDVANVSIVASIEEIIYDTSQIDSFIKPDALETQSDMVV